MLFRTFIAKAENDILQKLRDRIKVLEMSQAGLQCAACGFMGTDAEFYNSAVHTKFKICPKCGTVRFVCGDNRGYRREHTNDKNI